MDESLEILDPNIDPKISLTPERELWLQVILLTLEDLDSVASYLFEELVPRQRNLIVGALKENLTGRRYWLNRGKRAELVREKGICKREIYIITYCVESAWFEMLCDFAGVNVSVVRGIAKKIINRKLGVKLSKGRLELKAKLKPRRRRGRRLALD